METRKALASLRQLIAAIAQEGIVSSRDYSVWTKDHIKLLTDVFWYTQETKMPAINNLMRPFFHPTLPLIGFNYSQVAHLTLHQFPSGWTDPLRLCRGIIFDRDGNLLAMAFPKFFNLGEHPETAQIPDGPFEATLKHDGHLGIIFCYAGRLYITTRGSFVSNTSKIAQKMLDEYSQKNQWALNLEFFTQVTPLVEIIHPETHVHANYDYDRETGFILIGCQNLETLRDYHYRKLVAVANQLNLPVTQMWQGNSAQAIVDLMKSRKIDGDTEGWVVRIRNLRVKVKNLNYLERMLTAKFGRSPHQYVMRRMADHNLERALEALSAEEGQLALAIRDQIMKIIGGDGDRQAKWRRLYTLVPEEQNNSTFQATCRQLVKTLCA